MAKTAADKRSNRARISKQSDTDRKVLYFFGWKQSERLPVLRATLQEHASIIALEKSHPLFQAVNGWLRACL